MFSPFNKHPLKLSETCLTEFSNLMHDEHTTNRCLKCLVILILFRITFGCVSDNSNVGLSNEWS